MKRNFLTSLVILFCLILTLSVLESCKPDDDPDPCEGLTLDSIQIDFTMGEHITNSGGIDTIFVYDTALIFNNIVFEAEKGAESYEWTIGEDPRTFTERRFELFFQYPEQSLPIRLIAKRTPNLTCFPQDDGIDTVEHYLTIVDKDSNPIIGKYEGHLESDPDDIFAIQVTRKGSSGYDLININRGCDLSEENVGLGAEIHAGFRKLNVSRSASSGEYRGDCQDPKGWLILSENNMDVEVHFSTAAGDENNPQLQNRTNHVFVGKRLN
ncbi:MAG: hypothetical protein ACMVP2_20570 [Imperialibacter sp.]|uniref:hypothetical protein n=1 Tax=Imperialibacter sp. TaxID=2038411 RepID=UPI003A89C974